MKKGYHVTQDSFDALLSWFSADRDRAGAMYEEIRDGLVRFFRYRGCSDPEPLADETIDRFIAKLSSFTHENSVQAAKFFYSFAINVFREFLRRKDRDLTPIDDLLDGSLPAAPAPEDDPNEIYLKCLESCLAELPPGDRRLIIGYYGEDRIAKLEARRSLADAMGLSMPALHTRAHRIRSSLRTCIGKCSEI
jgi:DNA-directed RNA polymerase specialized sigma24 family protein